MEMFHEGTTSNSPVLPIVQLFTNNIKFSMKRKIEKFQERTFLPVAMLKSKHFCSGYKVVINKTRQKLPFSKRNFENFMIMGVLSKIVLI